MIRLDTERKFDPAAYRPRIIDKLLEKYLARMKCVILVGPKWCGKTWTGLKTAKSSVYLGKRLYKNIGSAAIDQILNGEAPRLIDEWQELPDIFDEIRYRVDMSASARGQYILTGSARAIPGETLHDGTGRFHTLRMGTMTLAESNDSTCQVSLEGLINGEFSGGLTPILSIEQIAFLVLRGGWPDNIDADEGNAHIIPSSYASSVLNSIPVREKVDPSVFGAFVEALGRLECNIASVADVMREMAASENDLTISKITALKYMDLLRRYYIIKDIPQFKPHLRSGEKIREKRKLHFFDPSLACSLMGASSVQSLAKDARALGFLFESLCIRDLEAYAHSFMGTLSYYRSPSGEEIDAIVRAPDGKWAAFEVKLSSDNVDSAAKKLIRVTDKLVEKNENLLPPSALCVLVGSGASAYRRSDNVYVIPISCLKG